MPNKQVKLTVRPKPAVRKDFQALLDFITKKPSGRYLVDVHSGRVVKMSEVEAPIVVGQGRSSKSPGVTVHRRPRDEKS